MPNEWDSLRDANEDLARENSAEDKSGLFNRTDRNILIGLMNAGQSFSNLPNYLTSLFSEEMAKKVPRTDYDFAQALNQPKREPSDILTQEISSFLPSMFLPGASLGRAGQAISSIPRVGKYAQAGLSQAVPQGLYAGALGLEEGGQNAIDEAALAAALAGGFGAAGPLFSKLSPSNLARSISTDLTPEQLLENQLAAQGTKTGLGRVIGSPSLAHFQENVLKYVPFSGYETATKDISKNIMNKAGSLRDKLTNGQTLSMEDAGEILQKSLQKSASSIRKKSSKNYTDIQNLADEFGISFEMTGLQNAAREALENINQRSSIKRNVSSDLISDLEYYANLKNPVIGPEGQDISRTFSQMLSGESPSATTAMQLAEPRTGDMLEMDILRSIIGGKGWENLLAGKRFESGKYNALKQGLQSDIDDVITSSEVPEIRNMAQKAKDYFIKNVTKLDKPVVKKFIDDPSLSESENIISTFIKSGPKQDRVKRMKMLTNHLDDESMNALRAAFFTDKKGNPSLQPWMSLGTKQKEVIVPDLSSREQLDSLAKLSSLNPLAFNQMFNPPTGQKNLYFEAIKSYGPEFLTGLAAFLNAGNPGALAGAAGIIGGSRGLNSLLTNEKVRDYVIKNMISEAPQAKGAPGSISGKIGSAINATNKSEKKKNEWESLDDAI